MEQAVRLPFGYISKEESMKKYNLNETDFKFIITKGNSFHINVEGSSWIKERDIRRILNYEVDIVQVSVQDFQELIDRKLGEIVAKLQPQNVKGPEYLTRADVKKMLHVSFPTLNELTKTGKLKGYHIGGRVLYKANEIEASLIEIQAKIQ